MYIRDLEIAPRRPYFDFDNALKTLVRRLKEPRTPVEAKEVANRSTHDYRILKGIDALAHPGELVLVLGRPGSGCTTLLQSIANQPLDSLDVIGTRVYAGFSASQFTKEYAKETVFCSANDVHVPSLTVGQTLGIDLDLTTPSTSETTRTQEATKDDMLSTLLALLGLSATRKYPGWRCQNPWNIRRREEASFSC